MAVSQPIPPLRASDADRERALRVLRDGSVEGRLSHETFVQRVDLALRARGSAELDELLSDLTPPQPLGGFLRAISWWSAFTARLAWAWRTPRLPRMVLPLADQEVFTIGRAADCDLILADIMVSGHHAQLRRVDDGWVIADLGSTNGTFANGWRVGPGFAVRPGDCVAFGRVWFRLSEHPLRPPAAQNRIRAEPGPPQQGPG